MGGQKKPNFVYVVCERPLKIKVFKRLCRSNPYSITSTCWFGLKFSYKIPFYCLSLPNIFEGVLLHCVNASKNLGETTVLSVFSVVTPLFILSLKRGLASVCKKKSPRKNKNCVLTVKISSQRDRLIARNRYDYD